MISFFVADRPASLRILKGSGLQHYDIKVGIMAHANTTKNFQDLFRIYPCSRDDFCDVIGRKCPYNKDKDISKCTEGLKIRERTIKVCDSGVFTKNGCINGYDELFETYENMGCEYGVIIDCLKNKEKTIESASEAINLFKENTYNFKLIGVAQGIEIKDYVYCYDALKNMGYDYIAVGGLLKKLRTPQGL